MDMTGEDLEIHIRTDANNLVTTATKTTLPEQKETIHMISSLRSEACSGSMDDLAHVVTDCQMADCLTKDKPKAMEGLKKAVETGRLPQVDTHPPFRVLIKTNIKLTLLIGLHRILKMFQMFLIFSWFQLEVRFKIIFQNQKDSSQSSETPSRCLGSASKDE